METKRHFTVLFSTARWHRPRPVAFLNYGDQQAMSSEYVDEYIKRNIAATESCKPPYDLRKSDVRMSGDTTFR